MFEQAPISGLTITCMKTVLEHGSFYIIPFILTGFICQKFHAESHPGKKVKLALLKIVYDVPKAMKICLFQIAPQLGE